MEEIERILLFLISDDATNHFEFGDALPGQIDEFLATISNLWYLAILLDSPFRIGDKFLDVVDQVFGDSFVKDDRFQRPRSHRLTEDFPLGRRTFGLVDACQSCFGNVRWKDLKNACVIGWTNVWLKQGMRDIMNKSVIERRNIRLNEGICDWMKECVFEWRNVRLNEQMCDWMKEYSMWLNERKCDWMKECAMCDVRFNE